MNTSSLVIGLGAIGFGLAVLVLRLKGRDEYFRKLGPWKDRFGPRLGSAIHYAGYVVVPIAFGIVALIMGSMGLHVLGGGR